MISKITRALKEEIQYWTQKKEENIGVAMRKTQKYEKQFYYDYSDTCSEKAELIKRVLAHMFTLSYRHMNQKNTQTQERFSLDESQQKIDSALMDYEGPEFFKLFDKTY